MRRIFRPFALIIASLLLMSCQFGNWAHRSLANAEPPSTTPSRVAITFDDLPYVRPSRTSPKEGERLVRRITARLAAHDIKATGFAVGQQVTPASQAALDAFVAAGHRVGNHSWSHPDYGTLSAAQFREETARTDRVLRPWLEGAKFYRFPFLRTGETEAAKAEAEAVLADLGYRNAPVTIDTDDWKFNADYEAALDKGQTRRAARIATAYVAHIQERSAIFQRLAMEELGGDVDHVLLLHLNRINADHLGTLLDWYAAQGWRFIPLEEAMQHPLFSMPDIYAGSRGLSQIERVLGGPQAGAE